MRNRTSGFEVSDYTYQELIYLEAAQWFKLKVCVADENRNRSNSAAFNSAPVLA
jgi:hypothetical protein